MQNLGLREIRVNLLLFFNTEYFLVGLLKINNSNMIIYICTIGGEICYFSFLPALLKGISLFNKFGVSDGGLFPCGLVTAVLG